MRGKNPKPKIEPALLTVQEVAAYLHVHPTTIYRLLKAGSLPGFRIGSDWRFNIEEIDRWRKTAQEAAVYGRRWRS